ncbi:MAG TPA: adenosine deaminase [Dehalococcoidia bacterium]|nr:adenosine deaminase [Dehalococcoidia bacterium]
MADLARDSVALSDLAELPKAELHVHLEGAIRPSTLEELCARSGLAIPRKFANLPEFIEEYVLAWRVLDQPGDYARVIREYCEDAARCGVRYAEIEIAPGRRAYDHLAEACEAALKQHDVVVRFVIGVGRTLPVEVGWRMLERMADLPGMVGIGLGGEEEGFPPEPFAELFAEGIRRGLRSTPHAGEVAGPASIRGALDALGAERIQHGIRAVEDVDLLAEIVRRRIALAVCPTSNVLLGAVATIERHPLRALWDAGALVSIHTDDPGLFQCDIVGEYAIAGRLLELDRAGYAQLALNSVEGSFAPDDLKAKLRAEIAGWLGARPPG